MNAIRNKKTSSTRQRLSLDVFKDKMVEFAHYERGGDSDFVAVELGNVFEGEAKLDSCHD